MKLLTIKYLIKKLKEYPQDLLVGYKVYTDNNTEFWGMSTVGFDEINYNGNRGLALGTLRVNTKVPDRIKIKAKSVSVASTQCSLPEIEDRFLSKFELDPSQLSDMSDKDKVDIIKYAIEVELKELTRLLEDLECVEKVEHKFDNDIKVNLETTENS